MNRLKYKNLNLYSDDMDSFHIGKQVANNDNEVSKIHTFNASYSFQISAISNRDQEVDMIINEIDLRFRKAWDALADL